MDIQETISRARRDYKDYLREKHPDWAESTLSTHVSDAFYLYQNTIALSFWKCFESDESMAAAKQDILDYLKNDVMSELFSDIDTKCTDICSGRAGDNKTCLVVFYR